MELLRYNIFAEEKKISFKKPILVFLHGLGGGYSNWMYQVRYLKKKYDLVLIELPSHGRSKIKMSDMELDFSSVARKIMDVLDHLKIEKATFLGLSLGSLAVKQIVLTYPERVDKYVLAGPIGKISLPFSFGIRLARCLLPILPVEVVVNIVGFTLIPNKRFANGRNVFLACAKHVEKKEFMAWSKVLLSFKKNNHTYVDVMKDEPNGLYLIGESDYFFLHTVRREIKHAKNVVMIENAGHICNIDQYEKVNELIVEFQNNGKIENQAKAEAYAECR